MQPDELAHVGPAGRGATVEPDRPRVRVLYEILHHRRDPLAPGANLLPPAQLDASGRDPQRAVRREQRRQALVVAHHGGVGELAAQRLDLDAVGDGCKVGHGSSSPSD
jgi:hypothetical protein